ncbi:MAG: hypothetical protein K2H46_03970 [Muribaculaceae bacterium]|nr:hypothetical protein [Muribaculaceae bacterium]
MTDEDIRKLATQYTDELFRDDDMSDSKNIDEYHDVWEVCNSFGNFLLEKFCIVEKEKARELTKLTLEHGDSDDYGLIDELVDWVCDNFDEEYREEAEK